MPFGRGEVRRGRPELGLPSAYRKKGTLWLISAGVFFVKGSARIERFSAASNNLQFSLKESPELIEAMISAVHRHCHLPISAKIRVLDTLSSTIEYARRIEAAGARQRKNIL